MEEEKDIETLIRTSILKSEYHLIPLKQILDPGHLYHFILLIISIAEENPLCYSNILVLISRALSLPNYFQQTYFRLYQKFGPENLEIIRPFLLKSLESSDPSCLQRGAYAISLLARIEYPVFWPSFFDDVFMNLNTEDLPLPLLDAYSKILFYSLEISDTSEWNPELFDQINSTMLHLFTHPSELIKIASTNILIASIKKGILKPFLQEKEWWVTIFHFLSENIKIQNIDLQKYTYSAVLHLYKLDRLKACDCFPPFFSSSLYNFEKDPSITDQLIEFWKAIATLELKHGPCVMPNCLSAILPKLITEVIREKSDESALFCIEIFARLNFHATFEVCNSFISNCGNLHKQAIEVMCCLASSNTKEAADYFSNQMNKLIYIASQQKAPVDLREVSFVTLSIVISSYPFFVARPDLFISLCKLADGIEKEPEPVINGALRLLRVTLDTLDNPQKCQIVAENFQKLWGIIMAVYQVNRGVALFEALFSLVSHIPKDVPQVQVVTEWTFTQIESELAKIDSDSILLGQLCSTLVAIIRQMEGESAEISQKIIQTAFMVMNKKQSFEDDALIALDYALIVNPPAILPVLEQTVRLVQRGLSSSIPEAIRLCAAILSDLCKLLPISINEPNVVAFNQQLPDFAAFLSNLLKENNFPSLVFYPNLITAFASVARRLQTRNQFVRVSVMWVITRFNRLDYQSIDKITCKNLREAIIEAATALVEISVNDPDYIKLNIEDLISPVSALAGEEMISQINGMNCLTLMNGIADTCGPSVLVDSILQTHLETVLAITEKSDNPRISMNSISLRDKVIRYVDRGD